MHNYIYKNNSFPYFPTMWDNYWRNYRINSETAIQIALQHVPGQVLKVELDYENGILVYEIYIRTPNGVYEVEIDANTGQLIEIELEHD